MPQRYRIIDHTADIAIRTSGRTMNKAFENAGYAMFDIMSDAASVKPLTTKKIECEAGDLEQLLVDWLSELLFICDVDHMLFSRFEVQIVGTKLRAKAFGEKMDNTRHHLKTDIKAVTYHMLEVDVETNTVQVLFDI